MDTRTLDWLLEEENPGVRLRTLTCLCGLPESDVQVIAARRLAADTLSTVQDISWMDGNGLVLRYPLNALAESGLTRHDVAIEPVVDRLFDSPYDANCGDFMLLRALVMLGYATDERFMHLLTRVTDTQMPDGAWFCLHRLNKMKKTPKSCMKAAMHALLFMGEMTKHGMACADRDALVHYFLKRRLCYRTDNPVQLVLHSRPGARTIDAFFPSELMRVGLPQLLEALAALGAGRAPELQEAWDILEAKRDALGRIPLEGTLAKSYLPKERVGRPGKWVTLYAWLAWNNR